MLRWTLRLLLGLVALIVVVVGAGFAWVQTDAGRAMLRDLAVDQVPGLRLDAIAGLVPFDMRLQGLAIADEDGEWLRADTARIAWAPGALIRRTLRIEAVEAGRLEVLRAPLPAAEPAPDTGPPAFPDLPVDIVLERLAVDTLVLGEALIGERAAATVSAAGRLGRPAEGLSLDLDIARTDGNAGTIRASAAFRPEGGEIALDIAVAEPPGGMIARLAGLPGAPAVTLDLAGTGTLDDFAADLALAAGPDLSADATLALSRVEDDARRLTLDGRVVPDAFLEGAALRALSAGGIDLDVTAILAGDGPIRLQQAEIAGAFGRLTGEGQVDTDTQALDLAWQFQAGAAERLAGLTGGADWETLALTARVEGSAEAPTVTLDLAASAVSAGGVAADALSLGATLAPDGPMTAPDTRVAVTASARAEGVDPGEPAAQDLLGAAPLTVDLAGRVGLDGDVQMDQLAVTLPAAEITAAGTVGGWGADGGATLALTLPRLDAFADLAGLALSGAATAMVDAVWSPDAATVDLAVRPTGLATGIDAVDGLAGGAPVLTVRLTRTIDGAVRVADLSLEAAGLTIAGEGDATTAGDLDATVTATIDDLSRIDPALAGRAVLDATLSGPLGDPAALVELALSDAVLGGQSVPAATLRAEAGAVLSAPAAAVTLAATVAGLPVDLAAALALDAQGGLAVDDLTATLASLSLDGAIRLDPAAGTVEGGLAGRVARLADFAALAGQPLTGGLEFDLDLSATGARQDARLAATLAGAGLTDQVTAGFAEVTAALSDLTGTPGVDAAVTARAVSAGGAALDRLAITATGDAAALDLTVAASGTVAEEPTDLEAAARIGLDAAGVTVALDRLSGRAVGLQAALAGPATVRAEGADIAIDGLALSLGDGTRGGTLRVDGRYGGTLDLTATVEALPLALADGLAPDLGLQGQFDAAARLTGTRAAPAATLSVDVTGASAAAIRRAGLPPADHSLAVAWQGGRLSADALLGGLADGTVAVSAAIDAPADPSTGLPRIDGAAGLAGSVDGRLDIARFNPLLAGGGTQIGGALTVALSAGGTLDQPTLAGSAALAGGRLVNPLIGIALNDIAMTLEGRDRALTLTRFSARTADGGTLGGSGSLTADPAAGFPGEFEIAFDEALVIASDIATVDLSGTLGVTGPLARAPRVVGRLVIPQAEIRLPETLPPSVPDLAVEEINLPPELAARRPPTRVEDAPSPGGGFVAGLDITVDAPQRVFVRGRGLDAEVGGRIAVAGTSADPQVTGAFTLRRGILDALGRRFDFVEGAVTLPADGSMTPELRFVARTDLEDAVAQIIITGRADDPQIAFESVPELPTDEIFARILFEKPTGSLTAFEAVLLAQQVAALTGVGGGGPDVLGGVRDAVGLDRLDVEAGDDDLESTTINAGSYVADGVFVGVEQGLGAESSRVTVEVEITDNITVESDVGADSAGRIGVNMQWDY